MDAQSQWAPVAVSARLPEVTTAGPVNGSLFPPDSAAAVFKEQVVDAPTDIEMTETPPKAVFEAIDSAYAAVQEPAFHQSILAVELPTGSTARLPERDEDVAAALGAESDAAPPTTISRDDTAVQPAVTSTADTMALPLVDTHVEAGEITDTLANVTAGPQELTVDRAVVSPPENSAATTVVEPASIAFDFVAAAVASESHPSSSSVASPSGVAGSPRSPKAKPKRKRNAVAGPSRAPDSHPAHWMGEDNGVIRCICGFTEDDGFSIQCDRCYAWEHGMCFGYLDESSAPDTFLCELCDPRPIDAASARQRQASRAANLGVRAPDEPERKRVKAKRSKTESGPLAEDDSIDPGQAAAKPKRRQTVQKPRSKPAPAERTTAPVPPSAASIVEQEDEYFLIDPWELEFTPVKANVVRGWPARQAVRRFCREWIEDEPRGVQHESGFPSPTDTGELRLSPDGLFPPPDFDILAPPVPPVTLAEDLVALAAPTSIRAVEELSCFLPPTFDSEIGAVVYARPPIYGVFADDDIAACAFIDEFRAEVLDAASYRHDVINQYTHLGLPKPHVRFLGPPVNLVLDARGYGSEMRFARSGCHPNAVLRPILARGLETQLKFGLFASSEISKGDEIVLAWEWDDQHVVHALRTADDQMLLALAAKCDMVLTHLLGTFTACACLPSQACALAHMIQVVDGKGKLGRRRGLGELVGAVRGWRRDELEADRARKMSRALPPDLFALSPTSLPSKAVSPELDSRDKFVASPQSPREIGPLSPHSLHLPSSHRHNAEHSDVGRESLEGSDKLGQAVQEDDDGNNSDATTATIVRDRSDGEADDNESTTKAVVKNLSRPYRAMSSDSTESLHDSAAASDGDDLLPQSSSQHSLARSLADGRPSSIVDAKPARRSRPAQAARKDKFKRARKIIASSDDDLGPPLVRATSRERTGSRGGSASSSPAPTAQDLDLATPAGIAGVASNVAPADMFKSEGPAMLPTPEREPPPREPSPPPEPPKKVALSEYLKNHKMRKVSQPVGAVDDAAALDIKAVGVGDAPASNTATSAAIASALNLYEHLPSRTPTTPALSPYTPSSATPAFVPRTDYFPPQLPGAAFVPRNALVSEPGPQVSTTGSAFVPRNTSNPTLLIDATASQPTSAFIPRDVDHFSQRPSDAGNVLHEPSSLPSQMGGASNYAPHGLYESPAHITSSLPPPATRESPPHSYDRAGGPFGAPGRPPPTGPRVPPTGPRGSWNHASGSGGHYGGGGPPGPVSPVAQHRQSAYRGGGSGSYRGGERGFFRGGRGPFRGRGRG